MKFENIQPKQPEKERERDIQVASEELSILLLSYNEMQKELAQAKTPEEQREKGHLLHQAARDFEKIFVHLTNSLLVSSNPDELIAYPKE